MADKKERWYNHSWILVIGAAVLTPIFQGIYNTYSPDAIVATKSLYENIVMAFINLLNYDVQAKWIILYILFWAVVRMVKGEIDKKAYKKLRSKLPRYLHYQADHFNSWDWRWDWNYNTLIKQWKIKNLTPVCTTPSCKYNPLEYEQDVAYGNNYKCSICKKGYFIVESENEIKNRILEKITADNFPITTTDLDTTDTTTYINN